MVVKSAVTKLKRNNAKSCKIFSCQAGLIEKIKTIDLRVKMIYEHPILDTKFACQKT